MLEMATDPLAPLASRRGAQRAAAPAPPDRRGAGARRRAAAVHRRREVALAIAVPGVGRGSGGGTAGGAGASGAGGSAGGGGGSAGSSGSAGASGSGGAAGTGGSSGSGGCPGGANDEFNDSCTAANWSEQHFTASAASWNIGQTFNGRLTIAFSAGTPAQTGWFENNVGPLVYKQRSGNFIVMTHVHAGRADNRTLAPRRAFNSAGLLVRNPASTTGSQNWIMHNIGNQAGNSHAGCPNAGMNVGIGSEAKNTVNSNSQLCLNPATAFSGRIAICRNGASFHALRKLDGEATWTETNQFTNNNIPAAVEVGVMANAWGVPADIRAEFDYVRFYAVNNASQCSPAYFNSTYP